MDNTSWWFSSHFMVFYLWNRSHYVAYQSSIFESLQSHDSLSKHYNCSMNEFLTVKFVVVVFNLCLSYFCSIWPTTLIKLKLNPPNIPVSVNYIEMTCQSGRIKIKAQDLGQFKEACMRYEYSWPISERFD